MQERQREACQLICHWQYFK